MKFVHARTEMKIKRTVNLIDGPRISHPDSTVSGKKIELVKVHISYVLIGDRWEVPTFVGGHAQIKAEGWILKADGSRSLRRWTGELTEAPVRTEGAWLSKLIHGARPTGVPNTPFDVTEA